MIEVTPAERGAINAKWGIRPQRQHMVNVLLDQFVHMRERENAQVRVPLHEVPDQPRNDQALAGGGRHRDQRMTSTGVPVRLKRL